LYVVHVVSTKTSFPLGTFLPLTLGLAMLLAAASLNTPMFSIRILAGSVPQSTHVSPSLFSAGIQQYVPTVFSGYPSQFLSN
jgi:hypothetical protein